MHAKFETAFFSKADKAGDTQTADRKRFDDAVNALDLSGYADAIYDDSTALVEAAWNNAKALLDVSTSFDQVPQRTLDLLRKRINDLTFLVQEREQEALRTTLDQAFTDGLSGDEVASVIRGMFADGYHRLNDKGEVVIVQPTKAWSEMVARTEMAVASTAGALDLYNEAGIKTLRWMASDPCFPAGTMIDTPNGKRAIEEIRLLDEVIVPGGVAHVTKEFKHFHHGGLTYIRTASGAAMIATVNHPIMVAGMWVEAQNVQPGSFLHTVDDKRTEVVTVVNLALSESNDEPTTAKHIGITANISSNCGFASVPVVTIGLDRNPTLQQGEVNGPTSDAMLFDELDANDIEGLSNHAFDVGLRARSSVAGYATVLLPAGRAAGAAYSAGLTTLGTNKKRNGAIASLGAVNSSVGVGSFDDEVLTAPGTCLDGSTMLAGLSPTDHPGTMARSATELIRTIEVRSLESLSALNAITNEAHLLIIRDYALNRGLFVYNLETTPNHVYFAEGVLVHNCDVCAEYDDKVYPIDDLPDEPPVHPNCRCALVPGDDDLGSWRGSDDERAAAKRGNS